MSVISDLWWHILCNVVFEFNCQVQRSLLMNENEQEIENLVMFPASKNYPPANAEPEPLDDPLEQLLNEFADYDDDDFIDDFDEEEFEVHPKTIPKLDMSTLGQTDCINLIQEQLSTLNEARSRLQYYLKDIEQHLPRKGK